MNHTATVPVTPMTQLDAVKILIVDDEPRNLTVLETVLDDPAYRLIRATSGDQALMALMAHEFAVLVLDVRMPGMTGFELAQIIKDRKKTARVPIIFLTAYYKEDQHILEGYGTGAVDYLHKPVNAAILRSKVGVFAELYRKGHELEVTNLALMAEVAERRRAEALLGELNQTLDRRVTERTEALQASEAQLRNTDRRKDEFLATLAHELRNPLAPIRNAVHILRLKAGAASDMTWAIELIERQLIAMSRLIDDLMDVSRINQGKIELSRRSVRLGQILQDAMEAARPLIEECSHELVLDDVGEHLVLHADRTRLAQAFTNLLTNAAKYMNPGGRIELKVKDAGHELRVCVADHGIGIPPDRLADVFEIFSQVESALSRSRGGLGIGLSLTRRLVEMHGGSVKARSGGLGFGSEFEVVLPKGREDLPAVDPPQVDARSRRGKGALRILVADDNRDATETLARLLEMQGHTVQQAYDGEAAVKAAQEFAPHLIFLDIGMPKVNGYDACRQIRTLKHGATTVVAAISGWGQPADRELSRDAGFDQHFVKPLDPFLLEALLASVAENSTSR